MIGRLAGKLRYMTNNSAQKVVVITGASSGIGAATAEAMAKVGAKLVLGARRLDKLQAVASRVLELGGQAEVMACDVGRREQVKALLALAQSRFGRVDVAIANAGFGFAARVHDTTEAQMEEIWRVNLLGTWYVMAEAAPLMLKQRQGHIIAVSSVVARRGLPGMGPYCMTKAGQLSLVEAMRVELRGSGVYVSSVHPGYTQTEFFQQASQRSGSTVHGGGKMQSADVVAGKIASLVARPRPELWPLKMLRWATLFTAMLPTISDAAIAKSMRPRGRLL